MKYKYVCGRLGKEISRLRKEKNLSFNLVQLILHGFIKKYFINYLLIFAAVGAKDASFPISVVFIKKKKSKKEDSLNKGSIQRVIKQCFYL